MNRYLPLLACVVLLSVGPLGAEAVKPAGPCVSKVQDGPCDGGPSVTASARPAQQGKGEAWMRQDLQDCMAGAANTMQGYRARYLICQSRMPKG
jgi:hypothetical protein